MQYFGVPKCPYCKKRVNFIRTWALRRQGEYKCPRCQGISNIYLSPLTHVFAVIAVFVAGILYFFHSFILNDLSLSTIIEVVIPFAAFYALSMFMVYLEKPVLKQKNKKRIGGHKQKPRPARSVDMSTEHFEEKQSMPDLSDTAHRGAAAGHAAMRQAQQTGQTPSAGMRRQPAGEVSPGSRELHSREERRQQVRQTMQHRLHTPSPEPEDRYSIDPERYGPADRYQEKELPVTQKSIEVTMPIAPRKPRQLSDSRVIEKIDIGDDVFKKYTDQEYVRERISEDGEKGS